MRNPIRPLAAVALMVGVVVIVGAALRWWAHRDIAVSIEPIGLGALMEIAAAVLFLLVVAAWFVLSRLDDWRGSRQ